MWPAFLDRLGAQKISLAAYLAESKPLARDGGALRVGLPGFALHQEVLSLIENRKLIAGILSELCGAPISVEYETLPASALPTPSPAASASASAPPVVQDIVKLFNATLLDRPPLL